MENQLYHDSKKVYRLFRKQLRRGYYDVIQQERVCIVDKDWWPQGNECKGFAEPNERAVYVQSGLSTEEKIITVLHEMIHINYPGYSEQEIEGFATHIYDSLNTRQQAFFEAYINLRQTPKP